MEHNVKTNLKLAGICATAMMTLSGCVKRANVIENVGSDKILVRDVMDGKERIIEFVSNRDSYIWERHLKYSCVGDTVILKVARSLDNYNKHKCFVDGFSVYVHFDNELHSVRQEQAKFDSLKCAIVRENQGKRR